MRIVPLFYLYHSLSMYATISLCGYRPLISTPWHANRRGWFTHTIPRCAPMYVIVELYILIALNNPETNRLAALTSASFPPRPFSLAVLVSIVVDYYTTTSNNFLIGSLIKYINVTILQQNIMHDKIIIRRKSIYNFFILICR